MIALKQKGNFRKIDTFVEKLKNVVHMGFLDKYGEMGVKALQDATPKDTGLTSRSWSYEITRSGSSVRLSFSNSNIQNGVQIAVILQYGHATRNGGWIEGRDYINPAIQPIFDEIAEKAWKEVTRL